jgi:CRISPR-associated protein Cmr3
MESHSYEFHIEPRDVLFMRDARPMEASDAGLGANWPRPDQIWNAFINAFHRRWPEHQAWEHRHRRNGREDHPDSSCRFGALKTAGPFPCATREVAATDNGRHAFLFKPELYLPCPLDLCADDAGVLHPMRLVAGAGTDLPRPLEQAHSAVTLGKSRLPQWIALSDYRRYLAGESFRPESSLDGLYSPERNIGIAIDPQTGSAQDGQLYQAEYLRFHPDARMAVQAECVIVGDGGQLADAIGMVAQEENIPLPMGGQQGMALLNRVQDKPWLPDNDLGGRDDGPCLLRWTLLSPAVFPAIEATAADKGGVAEHPGGWLPNWVDAASGRVGLPREPVERRPGEPRDEWRKRLAQAPRCGARLVAARVGKPAAFSGWDLRKGPKPTRLAVPAGSAYVFRCADRAETEALARSLAWNGGAGRTVRNRRSTIFGEKGYGLGVCSIIKDQGCGFSTAQLP